MNILNLLIMEVCTCSSQRLLLPVGRETVYGLDQVFTTVTTSFVMKKTSPAESVTSFISQTMVVVTMRMGVKRHHSS